MCVMLVFIQYLCVDSTLIVVLTKISHSTDRIYAQQSVQLSRLFNPYVSSGTFLR